MNTTNYFQISDPDLPFVAANAAIEIDDIIKGRGKNLTNVQMLFDKLNIDESSVENNYSTKSFIDPATTDVISKAYFASHGANISSHEEYSEALKVMANELTQLDAGGQNAPEAIRKFFVALSQYALAFQSSSYNNTRHFPYKK